MGSHSVSYQRKYDPYVVTFHCTSVYVCSPIAANIVGERQTVIGQENKSPACAGL